MLELETFLLVARPWRSRTNLCLINSMVENMLVPREQIGFGMLSLLSFGRLQALATNTTAKIIFDEC
jgi:hypothetical protein